jgi:ribosomal protein S18 acetylase RimI-like enzyme
MAAQQSTPFPKTIAMRESPDRERLDRFDACGNAVGFLKIDKPAFNVAYIWHLKVLKEYRNQGHAKELMRSAIDRIRAIYTGVTVITINACPFEDGACPLESLVRLYESFGFETFAGTQTTRSMKLDLAQKGLLRFGGQ